MGEVRVSTSVDLRGVSQKLLRFDALVDTELDGLVKQRAYAIRDELKRYDAPPVPGYRRTGRMSRQTVAQRDGPKRWLVEVRAPYSMYVRGTFEGKGQAYMHVGRWKKASTIRTQQRRGFLQEVRKMLKQAAKKAGLA